MASFLVPGVGKDGRFLSNLISGNLNLFLEQRGQLDMSKNLAVEMVVEVDVNRAGLDPTERRLMRFMGMKQAPPLVNPGDVVKLAYAINDLTAEGLNSVIGGLSAVRHFQDRGAYVSLDRAKAEYTRRQLGELIGLYDEIVAA